MRIEELINGDLEEISEAAPPGAAAEKWIKDNKKRFKKQYGKDWERVIYAKAWALHKKGSFD